MGGQGDATGIVIVLVACGSCGVLLAFLGVLLAVIVRARRAGPVRGEGGGEGSIAHLSGKLPASPDGRRRRQRT